MAYSPSTPVTGAAQTGFTSPTYTLTSDTAPTALGKQHAVTATGGTQTGVTTHSVSSPFTITFTRPKTMKTVGVPNSNGVITNIGRNTYGFLVRKGVTPAANQSPQVMLVRVEISVPAGSDTYDAANVKAALSAAIGVLSQQSAGIGDVALSGIL